MGSNTAATLIRSLVAALVLSAAHTERAFAQIGLPATVPIELQAEIRQIVDQVYGIAGSSRSKIQLEVYRTFDALNVSLTLDEKMDRISKAWGRGIPEEAVVAYVSAEKDLLEWALRLDGLSSVRGGEKEREGEALALKKYRSRLTSFQALVFDGAEQDRNGDLELTKRDAISTQNGRAFLVLGEAYFGARKWSQAESSFEKALTLDNVDHLDRARTRLNLGLTRFKSGKLKDAKTAWSMVPSTMGLDLLARALIENVDAIQLRAKSK